MERIKANPQAPTPWKYSQKTQKHRRHRQNALRRLLVTSATDRARLCARSRQRQPPGSPMGLPGEFQDTGGTESARTHGWSKTTRVYIDEAYGQMKDLNSEHCAQTPTR